MDSDNKVRLHNGQVVGEVRNGLFTKRVRASKHFLRVPQAIAFESYTLDKAEDLGAVEVCVIDTETGNKYFAYISTIRIKGFEFDRGFGRQLALPLILWNKGQKVEPQQLKLI